MSQADRDRRAAIVIVDYGMGNVRSVQHALERLGRRAVVSSREPDFDAADALILPGVGAFGQAMSNLRARGLLDVLERQVIGRAKPTLGICLGMQLFANSSDEIGFHEGLGWIPGKVVRIDVSGSSLSLPHVGWNEVSPRVPGTPFDRLSGIANFYFDHTFHFVCDDPTSVLATVEYGGTVTAAIRRANILGVQFHPEKSQTAGLKVLRSFVSSVEADLSC